MVVREAPLRGTVIKVAVLGIKIFHRYFFSCHSASFSLRIATLWIWAQKVFFPGHYNFKRYKFNSIYSGCPHKFHFLSLPLSFVSHTSYINNTITFILYLNWVILLMETVSVVSGFRTKTLIQFHQSGFLSFQMKFF